MIFFQSADEFVRITISALIIYPFIILAIRIVGKRSTSRMNNFDWLVTVALGSMMGSAIMIKKVVIFEAMYAISLLLALQYMVTRLSLRYDFMAKAVRSEPVLLYFGDSFQEQAMKRERISKDDIKGVVRQKGFRNMSEVGAVVIETDAELSVLPKKDGHLSILDNVKRK